MVSLGVDNCGGPPGWGFHKHNNNHLISLYFRATDDNGGKNALGARLYFLVVLFERVIFDGLGQPGQAGCIAQRALGGVLTGLVKFGQHRVCLQWR